MLISGQITLLCKILGLDWPSKNRLLINPCTVPHNLVSKIVLDGIQPENKCELSVSTCETQRKADRAQSAEISRFTINFGVGKSYCK